MHHSLFKSEQYLGRWEYNMDDSFAIEIKHHLQEPWENTDIASDRRTWDIDSFEYDEWFQNNRKAPSTLKITK